jgi:fucose permease
MSEPRRSFTGHELLLVAIAFFGIFVYGMLTALPGTVLPKLERDQFLPNDAVVGNFLLINAVGAVLSYLISGPVIDRIGKKFALVAGGLTVIASMVGMALVVTRVQPASATGLLFACSLVLGLGANAIVSSGHALVADAASSWRNSALNLLDVFFGLGLLVLPLVAGGLQESGGLGLVFWSLAGATLALIIVVFFPRFPQPTHPESFPIGDTKHLFTSASFWLLAIALFMYVGSEVAVGKWVVTYMQRDPQLLNASGVNAQTLQSMTPQALSAFFEQDASGKSLAEFALRTLSLFGFALLVGRLVSSFLLGVMKVNTFVLLTIGSILSAIGIGITVTSESPDAVRWAIALTGFSMGPIFPTSVGLASVIAPRIAGTAMSLVMGIGFAGLLVIPPSVGYLSSAVGGEKGDVRTGMYIILAAAIVMALLHALLTLRERKTKTSTE